MDALDLVRLTPLMLRSAGRSEIVMALIDGRVALELPMLNGCQIREVTTGRSACVGRVTEARMHGTFLAGILAARWGPVLRV